MELDSGGAPDCSVLEVIECLEQARDTIGDLEAKVDDLTAALKEITEASVAVCPTNDPFMWLQDIAETALKESE